MRNFSEVLSVYMSAEPYKQKYHFDVYDRLPLVKDENFQTLSFRNLAVTDYHYILEIYFIYCPFGFQSGTNKFI